MRLSGERGEVLCIGCDWSQKVRAIEPAAAVFRAHQSAAFVRCRVRAGSHLTHPHGKGAGMDHDNAKENWARTTNRYAGCSCEPWRYNPRFPKPTNPACEQHGNQPTR